MRGSGREVARIVGGQFRCPHCGLPQDRVATLEHDWVLLEPGMRVPAHLVPAEHRWIELSDGRVAMYGVCPVDGTQRCRIEHRLACAGQRRPDLWPWLTTLRDENKRMARRQEPAPPPGDDQLPDVG
jgi:hypothetical protein